MPLAFCFATVTYVSGSDRLNVNVWPAICCK